MRILFLNSAPIVKYGMAQGFAQLGHEVGLVVPNDQTVEGMLKRIDEFKPDLLFTDGGVGREESIGYILDKTGLPHVYWAIEDPVSSNLSLFYGKRSILTLTTYEEFIHDIYQQNQVETLCIPFACNPEYHHSGKHIPELSHDLVFMGNNYNAHQNRIIGYKSMFAPCLANGWDIAFYGDHNWINQDQIFSVPTVNYKGYLSNESIADLCASSNFILGVHSINGSKTMQAMRTFEVLGCGGFFFTQHTTAIEHMFQNHVHLVWSSSPEETVELYEYYKNRPERMDQIRRKGQEFVYNHHTYKHRVTTIMKHLDEKLS
jgi:spore maturation protein CgeB